MINDFIADGLYHTIFRSCYGEDGQETAIKKMCDEFTKRSKEIKQAKESEAALEGMT